MRRFSTIPREAAAFTRSITSVTWCPSSSGCRSSRRNGFICGGSAGSGRDAGCRCTRPRAGNLGCSSATSRSSRTWRGATGGAAGPYQHASHLVLRAIESRMGIARAANDGISEFIDPLGRAYAATRLETEASVADRLRTSDVIPLYVRLGDWVGLLVVLATIGFAGLLAAQAWKRRG